MKLTIIGASGHGKVVDIAVLCGYDGIEFLDDNENLKNCGPYPVAGPSSLAQERDQDLFVAIGDAAVRRRMLERFSEKRIPVLIHPGAIVAEGAKIGRGSVVMAGAVVNSGAVIGRPVSADHSGGYNSFEIKERSAHTGSAQRHRRAS